MKDLITQQFEESISVKRQTLETSQEVILAIAKVLVDCLKSGNKILFCGNGGSSCDAAHIAAELVVRYKSGNERVALPAMALGTDHAVLTACGNDYGYQDIFARQVEAFGREGDVLVGITTSGNSPNVIRAVEQAKKQKMKTVALLGGSGGALKGQCDQELVIDSKVTARIQETHILVGHILCSIIEKDMFGFD